MNKKIGIFGWILSFLLVITLISVGILAWTDFNLLSQITFNVGWLYKLVASVVAVLGLAGLINLVIKASK